MHLQLNSLHFLLPHSHSPSLTFPWPYTPSRLQPHHNHHLKPPLTTPFINLFSSSVSFTTEQPPRATIKLHRGSYESITRMKQTTTTPITFSHIWTMHNHSAAPPLTTIATTHSPSPYNFANLTMSTSTTRHTTTLQQLIIFFNGICFVSNIYLCYCYLSWKSCYHGVFKCWFCLALSLFWWRRWIVLKICWY